jgi:hypothetical protein
MKFGIHNPSFVFGPDPAEAFEGLKTKALWAETHGFTSLSVMDHLTQIPPVGQPDEPFIEGWIALSALAAVTGRIRLATLASSVAYRNPAHLAKIAAGVDLISRWPSHAGHRRRLVRDGISPIRLGVSRAAGGADPPTGGGRQAHSRDVVREANVVSRQVFPSRGRNSGAKAQVSAAGHDRRRRGATHAARGRPSGGRLQCVWRSRRGYAELFCATIAKPNSAIMGAIEKTVVIGLLLARDEATLAAKRARLGAREPFRGFAGTVSAVIDLAGRYQNAGVQTLICGALKNDRETLELLASDVIRRFG